MATPRKRKADLRHIHVYLDTNSIFSASLTEVVKSEVVDLIKKHGGYPDLKIHWVIPEIVVLERKSQMRQKTVDCLPNLEKLEKLVGFNWGVN